MVGCDEWEHLVVGLSILSKEGFTIFVMVSNLLSSCFDEPVETDLSKTGM